MKGIIIVLGSQNDEKGNLSPNSKNRVDRAIKELKNNSGYKLLLTGGFGKFNPTKKLHAFYLKKYALSLGVMEDDIIDELIKSGNTVEDAYLAKPILDKYNPEKIFVSTSNFHLPRAKYIFEKIMPEYNFKFLGSKENTSSLILKKLKLHEKMALASMKIIGIYLPNGRVIKCDKIDSKDDKKV